VTTPRAAAASSRSGSRRTAWRRAVRRTASNRPPLLLLSASGRRSGRHRVRHCARAEPRNRKRRESGRREVARPPESGSVVADRSGVRASRHERDHAAPARGSSAPTSLPAAQSWSAPLERVMLVADAEQVSRGESHASGRRIQPTTAAITHTDDVRGVRGSGVAPMFSAPWIGASGGRGAVPAHS